MKNSKSKKLFALLMALALVVGCAAGGTFAWLIASTGEVTNTFTAGDINIELKEHELNKQTGEWVADDKYVTANTDIELVPGRTIYKDPTVTVLKGSEPCYVRVFMIIDYTLDTDHNYTASDIQGWFYFNTPSDGKPGWIAAKRYSDTTTDEVLRHVFEFRYSEAVDASEEAKVLPATMYKITLPTDLSQTRFASLEDSRIHFIAQAVQTAGFEGETAEADAFAAAGLPSAEIQMLDGTSKTIGQLIEVLENQN